LKKYYYPDANFLAINLNKMFKRINEIEKYIFLLFLDEKLIHVVSLFKMRNCCWQSFVV